MVRHHQQFIGAILLLAVWIMAFIGDAAANNLTITLIVNPSRSDVSLGAEPIALTARAIGKDLTYSWKLLGPGKLEGEGTSVFYVLPEKIEGKSAQALITVTVKDETGQETTESMTFNILAQKGMSRTTKIALGVGAAAAAGGGIALIAGGGDDDDDSDGGNGEYTIVGLWYFWRGTEETYSYGTISFDGDQNSGSYTRIDEEVHETSPGTYLVEGTRITMDETDEIWSGIFMSPTELQGTWYRVENPDIKGDWGAER